MFQAPYRPAGRSVWRGADLAQSKDWIYELPPRAIADIDAALSKHETSNAYRKTLERLDFPLTTIAADIAKMREEIKTGRGFVVIRGLPKEKYSDNELGLIFRGFGSHFGIELTQSFYGDRLGDIRDVSDEIPDRNMRRGYHSGGFQTAHTDPSGALDIVAMLSLKTAKTGGESLIASAHTVHNDMLDWCPELLGQIYEGYWLRRPDSDAKALAKSPLIGKVPGFVYEAGWLNCDHQNGYIRRAQENGDADLTAKQRAALDVFTSISNHPSIVLKMMLEPGDFQFINNRMILHGRAAFEDHSEKTMRRHLYRLWLSCSDWPDMPESQSTLTRSDMASWDEWAAHGRGD